MFQQHFFVCSEKGESSDHFFFSNFRLEVARKCFVTCVIAEDSET